MEVDEEQRAKNIALAWEQWRQSVGLGPGAPRSASFRQNEATTESSFRPRASSVSDQEPIRTRVLITGGSSGVGEALVREFARDGSYDVFFTYNTGRERSERLVQSLGEEAARVRSLHLDQSDHASVRQLAREIGLKGMDVLILNAGLGSATVAQRARELHEQDQALMMCNAVGPLWLVREFLPGMRERRCGTIILVSSVGGGITQFPGFHIADGMSKAALSFMAKQLAAELVSEPIHVFAVCPGATETPMLEASTLSRIPSPEAREAFCSALPKGSLIQPDEASRRTPLPLPPPPPHPPRPAPPRPLPGRIALSLGFR
eukprot:tig00021012_g16994.t1